MEPEAINHEMKHAWRLLFGGPPLRAEMWIRVEETELRRAFKQRALEFHPDRAQALGRAPEALAAEFTALSDAYTLLHQALARRVTPPPMPARKPQPPARPEQDFVWRQAIPNRRLRLGQFAFYSGRLSWRRLARALTCQRQQGPSFGDLALQWHYLTDAQLNHLVSARRCSEMIGETAVRLGWLSPYQRDAVVGMQRKSRPKLGDVLVQLGFLDRDMIDNVELQRQQHNLRCAPPLPRQARAA